MSETVGSSMSSVRSIEQSLPVRQAAAPVQTDASNAAAAKQVAQTAVKSASQAQAQNQAAAAASKPAAAPAKAAADDEWETF